MTPGARLSAAIEIIDAILAGDPAALVLTNWARGARYAGSKDRAAVRDIVYDCLRQRRSLAFRAGAETGRALVMALAASEDRGDGPGLAHFTGTHYDPEPPSAAETECLARDLPMPDPVRYNYPDFLDDALARSLGARKPAVMAAMMSRAPVDLRVNLTRTTRAAAQSLLADADDILTEALTEVPTALRVTANARRVKGSKAFRDGLVELQDASSQAVTLFSAAASGQSVLDYCAGGGGKALALYDMMRGKGSVTAHDIATVRMNDLPARAARAKARIRIVGPGAPELKPGAFDLVFADAPCSGTGSWRRTPDAKWRILPGDLDRLDAMQATILDAAAQLVKPGGTLVYATCSILRRENDDRVDAFLDRTSDFAETGRLFLTPLDCGDGFFAARLKRL